MRLALYSRKLKDENINYVYSLFDFLKKNNVELFICEELVQYDLNGYSKATFLDTQDVVQIQPDLLVSLGGDGTILDTVLLTRNANIAVLGVNLGRLGFLAGVNKEHSFEAILGFADGSSLVEERMLLEVNSNIPIFINENIALNDLTFLRANTSSMIEVTVYANGELLNEYTADGLIVSTSTGSTGYNLSCGGPILHPSTNSFIITPIAPHNLNIRPIVLPDDTLLSFEVKGRTPEFLCTLDARLTHITEQHVISVSKAKNSFKIYQPNETNFWDALKEKMHWGRTTLNF
jgi:NAD+ kinase